ncbi:MAG: hypothetical protein VX320_05995 [Candidatus Thermoplasmatota archaeon]|nr:hypothetical protein [Candidatus Thermoplasmatota archaeon]
MALGGGDAVSPTAALLTIALLSVPALLASHPWLPPRLSRIVHLIPALLLGGAVLFRIQAMWIADTHDAQVISWLPENTDGPAALLHIFDGPAGLMLGLLFGFALGIAIRGKDHLTLRIHRWAALCWLILLGWGTPSDGFARHIDAMPLTAFASETDWKNLAIPFLGLGLSLIVIPTLSQAEISGPNSLSTTQIVAAFSIGLLLLDLSDEIAMSAVMILLVGSLAHLIVSLWIEDRRGQPQHGKWCALLVVFFYSSFAIILGLSFLASSAPQVMGIEDAIWSSRLSVGWILVCGLAGSLLPTVGWDSRPRPEIWGFLSGLLVASALLPRMELIEYSLLPILLLSVTMPIVASLVESKSEVSLLQRMVELLLILASHIISILLVSKEILPLTTMILIIILPIFWIHYHSHNSNFHEEE